MVVHFCADILAYEDTHPVMTLFSLKSVINFELWQWGLTVIAELGICFFRYQYSEGQLSAFLEIGSFTFRTHSIHLPVP